MRSNFLPLDFLLLLLRRRGDVNVRLPFYIKSCINKWCVNKNGQSSVRTIVCCTRQLMWTLHSFILEQQQQREPRQREDWMGSERRTRIEVFGTTQHVSWTETIINFIWISKFNRSDTGVSYKDRNSLHSRKNRNIRTSPVPTEMMAEIECSCAFYLLLTMTMIAMTSGTRAKPFSRIEPSLTNSK